MIEIIRAEHLHGHIVGIEFSDGSIGDYDLAPLLAKDTELTKPLLDPIYFKRFFLDLGALCWPNGLELSPQAIHMRLEQSGALRRAPRVA